VRSAGRYDRRSRHDYIRGNIRYDFTFYYHWSAQPDR
jgi:hypothetical protein